MNQLSKPTLQVLRKDLDEALAAIGAKHGLKIASGRCSFTALNATMKIEIAVLDASGVAETREMAALKLAASATGVDETTLFREFRTFTDQHYVLCGYCPRKPKYPFLATCREDGRRYGLTRSAVMVGLGFPINSDKLSW